MDKPFGRPWIIGKIHLLNLFEFQYEISQSFDFQTVSVWISYIYYSSFGLP